MSQLVAIWISLILLLALLGVGAFVGWELAHERLGWRRRRVSDQEARLQAEWDALHTAQRLNVAFMEARRAMAAEAIRQHRGRHLQEPDQR